MIYRITHGIAIRMDAKKEWGNRIINKYNTAQTFTLWFAGASSLKHKVLGHRIIWMKKKKNNDE